MNPPGCQAVPMLFCDTAAADALTSALWQIELDGVRTPSLVLLAPLACACGVAVVEVSHGFPSTADLAASDWDSMRSNQVRLVAALRSVEPELIRRAGTFSAFLALPGEMDLAARYAREALHSFWRRSLDSRIRSADPPIVAAALRAILASGPAAHRFGSERTIPPRTIQELASRLGVSRSYLSRLASKQGVPLRALMQSWLALEVVRSHLSEGSDWDDLAARVGYSSVAGLSELSRRVAGKGLRAMDWETLAQLEVEFDRLIRAATQTEERDTGS